MTQKIALVTGANRGIGLEVSKQLVAKGIYVYLGSRDLEKGKTALKDAGFSPDQATTIEVDVKDRDSCFNAVKKIEQEKGRLDILVNNAGVYADPKGSSVLTPDYVAIRETIETNTFGALRLIEAAVPGMKKRNYGRIVNVSSGMGQLEEMEGQYVGYRLSKTALNAVTRIVAAELGEANIQVNSVCPGWVRTDMGGPNAEKSVEDGADTLVWLATQPDGAPAGGFFREREKIAW